MKRAIVMVIDSMGIGAMDDCRDFGDIPECNTLKHVCEFNNGLNVPNMEAMGLGNIQNFLGIKRVNEPTAKYGTMIEKSKGKDTTTGHWEMAGLVSEKPFSTYPNGFPQELIEKFIEETKCGGILANCPASGTAIIAELNEEHHKTGFPIVYTSADSVFQIALDTDLIPLETLYKWCEIARKILLLMEKLEEHDDVQNLVRMSYPRIVLPCIGIGGGRPERHANYREQRHGEGKVAVGNLIGGHHLRREEMGDKDIGSEKENNTGNLQEEELDSQREQLLGSTEAHEFQ